MTDGLEEFASLANPRMIAQVSAEHRVNDVCWLVLEFDARSGGWFLFGHRTLKEASEWDSWHATPAEAFREAERRLGVRDEDWLTSRADGTAASLHGPVSGIDDYRRMLYRLLVEVCDGIPEDWLTPELRASKPELEEFRHALQASSSALRTAPKPLLQLLVTVAHAVREELGDDDLWIRGDIAPAEHET